MKCMGSNQWTWRWAPLVGVVSSAVLLVVPLVSYAADSSFFPFKKLSLRELVDTIIKVVGGTLIPLAITVLFLVFVYGIVVYIKETHGGSKNMAELAVKRLWYPVIILLLVFTLWGIIAVLRILFSA